MAIDNEKSRQPGQQNQQAPGKDKPAQPYNPNPVKPGKQNPGEDGERSGQGRENERDRPNPQR